MRTVVVRTTAALAAISGVVRVAAPLAGTDTVHADVTSAYVESGFVQPQGTIQIDIVMDATAPGLGAWNVDLEYDDSLVTLTHVSSEPGLCSPDFGENVARAVGASANGLTGTIVLCTLTFEAGDEEGVADLAVTINQLTDPTGADLSVSPEDGSITISQVTPTPVPTPSPTASPSPTATLSPTPLFTPAPVLPSTGGPESGERTDTAVVVAIGGVTMLLAAGWTLRELRQRY